MMNHLQSLKSGCNFGEKVVVFRGNAINQFISIASILRYKKFNGNWEADALPLSYTRMIRCSL